MLPQSLNAIGGYVFYNNLKLKRVEMPATIFFSRTPEVAKGENMFSNCPSLKQIVLYGPKPPNITQHGLNNDGIGVNFVVRSLCESTAKNISANPEDGYDEYYEDEDEDDLFSGVSIPDNPDTGDYSTCVRGEAAEMVIAYAENNNLCDTLSVCPDFASQPEVFEVKARRKSSDGLAVATGLIIVLTPFSIACVIALFQFYREGGSSYNSGFESKTKPVISYNKNPEDDANFNLII